MLEILLNSENKMMYFASKGLFVKEIEDHSYVILDVFGTCSLPFLSSEDDLDKNTFEIAKVRKLVTIGVDSESPDLSDFKWDELERYYIDKIDSAFLASLLNKEGIGRYNSIAGSFPIGYRDCGYGDSSKGTLESIHSAFSRLCGDDRFPVQKEDLELFLVTNQVERICNDIVSLVSRSISSYTEILKRHRECICKSYQAIEQLETNEIIHRGNDSYQAASSVTSLIISLCSSLDLSAKLIQYMNSIDASNVAFKPARDKQYHEVKKISSKFIQDTVLSDIVGIQNSISDISEMIQFRNDLIHSTSAIELEKIYVGIGTGEINNNPLFYSAQYARDCLDSGQPVRFLGRDYFVEGRVDIEVKTLSWIHKVFEYHIGVAEEIHSFLVTKRRNT